MVSAICQAKEHPQKVFCIFVQILLKKPGFFSKK
jgi:hypothetical protein